MIANVNRGEDQEPYSAADFMPGAKTEREEMEDFVDAINRGDSFDVDQGELARFKSQMESTFILN